jgi:hypothetical protein
LSHSSRALFTDTAKIIKLGTTIYGGTEISTVQNYWTSSTGVLRYQYFTHFMPRLSHAEAKRSD